MSWVDIVILRRVALKPMREISKIRQHVLLGTLNTSVVCLDVSDPTENIACCCGFSSYAPESTHGLLFVD